MEQLGGSFRDPAGFVFRDKGKVYRQINQAGKADFDLLISSGLYDSLAGKGLLVSHKEVSLKPGPGGYKIIQPEQVGFISYPYEWAFSQLKDAALTTLSMQEIALEHGMVLKDASAYNIQFVNGAPKFIDTLSFEKFSGGSTWKAYKQFCQHFLAPLALMSQADMRLGGLTRNYIDGIPLDLAVELLPRRKRVKPGIMIHLWMHSSAQQRFASSGKGAQQRVQSRQGTTRLKGQIDSLRRTIKSLKLPSKYKTEWGEYYTFTNYEGKSLDAKEKLVAKYVEELGSPTVWDMGGNDGRFSRIAVAAGAKDAVCFDIDPIAVEKNYVQVRENKEQNVLPLLLDLTNPSPAIGWANQERQSVVERADPKTTVFALALIHHLAISNNLPLENIAEYFAKLGKNLVIEFVPKGDSKVEILLSSREDIFPSYTVDGFEEAFGKFYKTLRKDKVSGSKRIMYLMERKRR